MNDTLLPLLRTRTLCAELDSAVRLELLDGRPECVQPVGTLCRFVWAYIFFAAFVYKKIS